MATHSSNPLAQRIPIDRGTWHATAMGSLRVGLNTATSHTQHSRPSLAEATFSTVSLSVSQINLMLSVSKPDFSFLGELPKYTLQL